MRTPAFFIRLSVLAAVLAVGLAIATTPAVAQNPSIEPASLAPAAPETSFRLHETYERCGKRWLKQFHKLSEEQQAWLLKKHHAIYRVAIGGRASVIFEILSTANFRECRVRDHWQQRATAILTTFLLPNGSERRTMSYLGDEEAFFNRVPTFFPSMGKVLLRGVDRSGGESNRWLEMEPLKAFHRQQVLLASADP